MLQKIKDFYHPELSGSDSFVLYDGEGNKKFLSFRDNKRNIYLTFGIPAKTEKEAIDNGAHVTTPQDLGKLLFPEEWEHKIKLHILPDKRVTAYLTTVKQNIGFIDSKFEEEGEGIKFDKVEIIPIWFNASDIEIGKDNQDRWVAEFSQRTDIDSYVVIDFIFNRKPTKKMIQTANLSHEIETYFNIHGWENNSFTCWECGIKTNHWLDIEGDLETKWNNFKDRYCGC